jgi:hypothetical protein
VTDPQLVAWTADPAILAILLLWGFGEAVALPIVPDVLLGLLAIATPAALGLPLVVAITGGLLGAIVLAQLRRRRPGLVDRILDLQPDLGARGMADAHRRIVERGATRAFAQVGPGLPLKAYVVALVDARPSLDEPRLFGLALLNRATRIVPVVAAFAVVGQLARSVGASPSAAAPVYVVGWTVFYLAFWWSRRP